ncbi:MAG: division/cell wall cluster transcriptional repressor MraZ [Candidatus Harrisonbacteria bacterium]|nr:division/cell wall cluster transcriptional repressor MraZ [Candidatus Harrisonbacteria bacterium]MBI2603979.1 division/cell wall cluster transcriptional repressor MraZ [Candidatus Harrisonbacteria bacterium]MBI3114517.1 division/cell wall cluster transcriptional repressor MraZ [Candidatus Harrisonbacteria bacterium]
MFIGEYQHNIDAKGRMAVPAKFRGKLGTGAIITRGLDKCLFIFNAAEWETLAQKVTALPISQSGARAFARFVMSGATDVEFDAQGRVLIPEHLRAYACLTKGAIVAGVYNRIEVWDEAAWKEYKAKTESASDEIAEKLGELGI